MKSSRRRFVLGAGGGLLLAGSGLPVEAQEWGVSPPPPPPPSPEPVEPGDLPIWDGASGVTSSYFNRGALIPWQNKGGDWFDAAGAAQGTNAYAAFVSHSVGPFSADITALVHKWYSTGNSGIYLRCSGAGAVASRTHSDPARRPVLLLKDSSGALTRVPCKVSAPIDLASSYSLVGTTLRLGTNKHALLQFQLPQPAPAFVSARLQFTCVQSYFEGLTMIAYELRRPKLFKGGTAVQGLAAKYLNDVGISSDPDVYFTGFSDFPEGINVADTTATADPRFPNALHSIFKLNSIAACTLNHRWSTKREWLPSRNANGLLIREEMSHTQYYAQSNSQCPSELYFRYYLKLQEDYQCDVEGKKLPGLAGRYGEWTGTDRSGYYRPTAGNGGSPTKGTFNGTTLSGWSMRHHAYVGPSDNNPLGDLIPLNYYAYHAAMTGWYGDYWRWGSASLGYVNLEAERWYCIEHYVKVNSLTGAQDALGNMAPISDGVVRGWLDGVLVFERTNVILRKHPAIRIDEVWLDHYHGGTIAPEAEHRFSMAALVVARKYIGPLKSAVAAAPSGTTGPDWLAGKPLNQWISIPGTALASSGDLQEQINAGLCGPSGTRTTYGHPRRGIMDFSGGALKRDGSELLIFGGGGAGAWAGNDVRSLQLEDATPVWRTSVKPSDVSAVYSSTDPSRTPHPYMKNGTPNARHSYWQPQFIDSLNRFMAFGCQNVWETDTGTFNTVDSATPGGSWSPAGSHPNIPAARGYDGSWVCKDPSTENVYAATASAIHRFSPGTNTWTTVYGNPAGNGMERGCAAVDTNRKLLLRLGFWKGAAGVPVTVNLVTGQLTAATLSGAYASIAFDRWGAGIVYDPLLDKFVVFRDDGFLYTMSYVSDAEWSVNRLALTGTPPDAGGSGVHRGGGTGIWGRMQYVPNLKGICIIQRYDKPAYFVRTA